MTNPDGTHVDLAALTDYAGRLGHYGAEADKFGALIDRADVTDEAWGLIGVWAKKSYTDRLGELRSLLAEMKEGVGDLTTKVTDSVAVYQGNEDDKVMQFGRYEPTIDGPK